MAGKAEEKLELDRKIAVRVLRFLLKSSATLHPSSLRNAVLLDSENYGSLVVSQTVIRYLQLSQLIVERDNRLHIGDKARQFLQRNAEKLSVTAHRQTDIVRKNVMVEGQAQWVDFNHAESPLTALYRSSKPTGTRFLSQGEYQAGERLRRDFTRGNMLPRISANWEACVTQRQRGDRGGVSQLSETALAARQRVEQAIIAVGPELSEVLIDVCCFLKGMQHVERERNWPARSAKILLKAALGSLHRFYTSGEGEQDKKGSDQSGIVHWGAQDYRPVI